ncbi:MAG: ATP-dependent Clp protease adaptor ClpS [Spirochaetia bacterium]
MSQKYEGDLKERSEEDLKEPEMYTVVLHNDHYTTMEFVVEVLVKVFNKQVIDATKVMMDVHKKGRGSVGIYTYDVASTKQTQTIQMAREREFPLKCTVEKT